MESVLTAVNKKKTKANRPAEEEANEMLKILQKSKNKDETKQGPTGKVAKKEDAKKQQDKKMKKSNSKK